MSLESATKISELVATNPTGTDPKSQGDDHLRMVKLVMQNNAIKSEIGQSATAANNFSLDASADNGTMKLARASGQDIMTVDAAGKVAFPQMVQSWQNFTVPAQRAFDTTYTNDTGQDIQVAATAVITIAAGLNVNINGVLTIVGQPTAAPDSRASIYFTVPPGATYLITSGGALSSTGWRELR